MSPTAAGLKMKIKRLEKYFTQHSLKVHMDKTKVMVFRKGGRLEKGLMFKYQGQVIDIVNKYTYLGVPFSSSGVYNIAAHHFRKKGSQHWGQHGTSSLRQDWKAWTRSYIIPGISEIHCSLWSTYMELAISRSARKNPISISQTTTEVATRYTKLCTTFGNKPPPY